MLREHLTIGPLSAALLTLTGCMSEEGSIFSGRYNFSGAATMIDDKSLEQFDDKRMVKIIEGAIPTVPNTSTVQPSDTLDDALAKFYSAFYNQSLTPAGGGAATGGTSSWVPVQDGATVQPDPRSKPIDKDMRFYVARNEIQDQFLAASVQRCDAYKKYLRHLDGSEGFTFGALGTIFGGVGAIVTGQAATRLFSGLAGITSGVGAEARQNIFSNLASSVIVPGIEKRRNDILQDILNKRCHSVTTYTVSLAIADSLKFHAACTMDVGIEEASQSVAAAQNPGLDSLQSSLDKFSKIQQTMITINSAAKGGNAAPSQNLPKDQPAGAKTGSPVESSPQALGSAENGKASVSAPNSPARSTTIGKLSLPVDCSAVSLTEYTSQPAPQAAPVSPAAPN